MSVYQRNYFSYSFQIHFQRSALTNYKYKPILQGPQKQPMSLLLIYKYKKLIHTQDSDNYKIIQNTSIQKVNNPKHDCA